MPQPDKSVDGRLYEFRARLDPADGPVLDPVDVTERYLAVDVLSDEAIDRAAERMAENANRTRYVLESDHQSTGVEPYEYGAHDFRDLVREVVDALTGESTNG